MATRNRKKKNIIEEIMDTVNRVAYRKCLRSINDSDIVSIEEFDKSDLAKDYWLDTSKCISGRKQNKINNQNIYDVFGDYSNHSSDEVCKFAIKEVTDNQAWYRSRCTVALSMKFTTIEDWLKEQKKHSSPGDEISLFALSVIYRRHTIVFMKSQPWCTVEISGTETATDIINTCETHLLYLGPQLFSVLRNHPFTVFGPRRFDLGILQSLRSVDREDGQLLIEKPLDLSCTRKIELCNDRVKLPLAQSDILQRHQELKEKAHAPPLVILSDCEEPEPPEPAPTFGLMLGFIAFMENARANPDASNDQNFLTNATNTHCTEEIAVATRSNTDPEPQSTSVNLPDITNPSVATTHVDIGLQEVTLPDVTNSDGSPPNRTSNVKAVDIMVIPSDSTHAKLQELTPLQDVTSTTIVNSQVNLQDVTPHVVTSPASATETRIVQHASETSVSKQASYTNIGNFGVRDVLLGSTLASNLDTDSNAEYVSLLTGEPVIPFVPVTSYPDNPDFLANLGLSPMRPPLDVTYLNWNQTDDNNDHDSDEEIIDPLYRYYEAPICGGKYTMCSTWIQGGTFSLSTNSTRLFPPYGGKYQHYTAHLHKLRHR